jgi:hypothetical protein
LFYLFYYSMQIIFFCMFFLLFFHRLFLRAIRVKSKTSEMSQSNSILITTLLRKCSVKNVRQSILDNLSNFHMQIKKNDNFGLIPFCPDCHNNIIVQPSNLSMNLLRRNGAKESKIYMSHFRFGEYVPNKK